MAVNAEALLPALVFTGQTNSAIPGDKAPADFVRLIEQRATQHNWNDARTMSHAIACIQGEAASWLYGSYKLTISPAEWTRVSTSWESFLTIFKARYRIRDVPAQTDISGIRKQAPGEPTMKFMDRVARTFGTLIGKESFLNNMTPMDLAVLPAGVRDAINASDDVQAAYANAVAQQEKRQEQHTLVSLIESLVKKTIAAGLKHEYAQQIAYTMADRTTEAGRISLFDFQNKILEITERKDNIAKPAQQVRAITLDSEEEEEDDAVNAIRSKPKSKKKNKKRGGEESNNSAQEPSKLHWSKDPKRNPSFGKQCDYCQKFNHIKKDCYKRKREESKGSLGKGYTAAASDNKANLVENNHTQGVNAVSYADAAKPRSKLAASLNF